MARNQIRSALAEYVHLTSQGYREHGTYRPNSKKTNYDNGKIFSTFQNDIKNLVSKTEIFKDNLELKKAQTEYNNRRKANYETLKKMYERSLLTDKKFAKQFSRALLDAANLPNLDEEVLIEILKFDSENDSSEATAKGVSLLGQAFSNGGSIKKIVPFKGSEYARLSTFENRVEALKKQILFLEMASSNNKKGLKKEQMNLLEKVKLDFKELTNLLSTILELSKNKQISNEKFKKELNEYDGNLKIHIRETEAGHIQISRPLATWIDNNIQRIQNKIKISNVLKNIQAGFSEVMAGLTGTMLDETAEMAVFDAIKESVVGAQGGVAISKAISQKAKETEKRLSLDNDFFHLEITSKRALGKIDAVFTLSGEEYYTSVKNYNLAKEQYFNSSTKTNIDAAVSLVTETPLTTTLLNAEAYKQTLGTHFLNILTEKEDGFQSIEAARNLGLSALSVFLVYLGLTEGHDKLALRESKGVNLLIIEDKASQKAYFFSISSILEKAIADINNNFLIEANGIPLTDFIIKNKRISDRTGINQNIDTRLKNILIEARAAKMHVALKNSTIKNIMNKREF